MPQNNIVNIGEIFTIQNVIIYLILLNVLGFMIMLIDKRKAEKGKWRIPEKTIFIITALGGGIGTISGMYVFRHKTQKMHFVIGLPAILLVEIIGVIYFLVIK